MKSWLSALLALLLSAPFAQAAKEPTFDAFTISLADVTRVFKAAGNEQLEITLCPPKAKEFLAFTRRHLGQTVVIAWMEPKGQGYIVYSNFLAVKSPIANGTLRVTNPSAPTRPGTLIAD
jgi:hypothetical protein